MVPTSGSEAVNGRNKGTVIVVSGISPEEGPQNAGANQTVNALLAPVTRVLETPVEIGQTITRGTREVTDPARVMPSERSQTLVSRVDSDTQLLGNQSSLLDRLSKIRRPTRITSSFVGLLQGAGSPSKRKRGIRQRFLPPLLRA